MAHRSSHKPNTKKNVYGATFRKIRVRAEITQAQLANKLTTAGWDVDPVVISYIEKGKRMLTDVELSLLLEALGSTLSNLESVFQESDS